MPARKLSIGDAVIAQAALTQIVDEANSGNGTPREVAEGIIQLAAFVSYKPVSGALTLIFDLSGPELVPAKHASESGGGGAAPTGGD